MKHLLLTMMGCVLLLTQIGCTALEVESGDQNRHVFRARNFSGAKHKVAVVKFTNKAVYGGELGDTAATLMDTELGRSNYFEMYDRRNLAASGRELRYTGGKIRMGRLGEGGGAPAQPARVELDAIITGEVTSFSVKTGGHNYFFYVEKYQEVQCTVDVSIINHHNGRRIGSETGHAKFKIRYQGSGVLGGGSGATYDQSLAQKALRRAIDDCIERVITQIARIKPATAGR